MLPTVLAAATLALYLFMVSPAINPQRWPFAVDLSRQGVAFALIGLLILILFLHRAPALIPIFILMIAVHEYGHVLAFRLAGHRHPVFRLAPFGGVAFSERPASSQQESAFISMMGPGFSIALVLAALLAVRLLLPEQAALVWVETTLRWTPFIDQAAPLEAWRASTISILLAILHWTAFLNFLNLLPFFPLDGGRTLRSIASGLGPLFADRLLYALTGLLVLFGLLGQNIFLIAIGIFGLVGIRGEEPLNRRMPPISRSNALLVTGAYLSMLVFFCYFSLPLIYDFIPPTRSLRQLWIGG